MALNDPAVKPVAVDALRPLLEEVVLMLDEAPADGLGSVCTTCLRRFCVWANGEEPAGLAACRLSEHWFWGLFGCGERI